MDGASVSCLNSITSFRPVALMRGLILALLIIVVVSPAAFAQDNDVPPVPIRFPIAGGAAFTYAQPTGEFRDYINQGFGIDVHGAIPFDSRGIFSVRIEAGFTNYGNEKIRVPLSSTIGNLIMVDVTTSNNIFAFGLGPQVTVPSGPVRPYAAATLGGSYFATQSRVEGTNNQTPFAESTNFDDFVLTLTGTGGVLVPLGRHEGARFLLDLGSSYHHNGPTRYLREGSLRDIQDDSIDLIPIESRASYFNFRVGLVVRSF
jgi:hypothetical protein